MKKYLKIVSAVLSILIACMMLPVFAETSGISIVGTWKDDYGDTYTLYSFNEDGSLIFEIFSAGMPEPDYTQTATWALQGNALTIVTDMLGATDTQYNTVSLAGDILTVTTDDGSAFSLTRFDDSAIIPQYCDSAKAGSVFIAYTEDTTKYFPVEAVDGSIPLVMSFPAGTSYHQASGNMLSIVSDGLQFVAADHGAAQSPVSAESIIAMAEKAAARYGENYSVTYSGGGSGFVQAVYQGMYTSDGVDYPYIGVMAALESELEYFSLECINTAGIDAGEFNAKFLAALDRMEYNEWPIFLGDRRVRFEIGDYSLLMPDGWSPIAMSETEANINGKGFMRFYDYSEFDRGVLRTALDTNGGYENMDPIDVIDNYIKNSSIAQYDPYTDSIRSDIRFTNGQACVILAGQNLSGLGGCSAYAIIVNERGVLLITHNYQYLDDTDAAIGALHEIIVNSACKGEALIISEETQATEPVSYDDDFYW